MTAKNRHKLWIWVGSILGTLILLIAFGAMFISAKWKPILSEKIKEAVYDGSKHLYTIDFKTINLNIVTGSLAMGDVKLKANPSVFDSLKTQKIAPAHIFEIELKKLQISRVGILTAYFKKRLNVGEILLDNPSIHATYNKVQKKTDTAKSDKTLYDQISKTFKMVHVNNIRIVDADFDYTNKSTTKKTVNKVSHVDIRVKDFLLDSLSERDTTRFYYTKDVSFRIAGYKSVTKDKMYNMRVDTIMGSAASKNILVKGLKLTPLYPELTFARKYKVQKDRYNLNFGKIELKGVDFVTLNTDQKLHASSLRLEDAKVEVFMSRESGPPPGLDKGKNFPHVALKRLNFPIRIDTVKLSAIDVHYAEYNPASRKKGSVSFNALNGNILNVTNDSVLLSKNNHAVANLNTLLMGKGKLNVRIDFNLTDKNGAFAYSGNMNNFDFTHLNPLSKALGLVEIESGYVNHVDFKAQGNTRMASGSINMLYKNLKVKMLSDNIDGEGTKEKGLLSFLANNVLVKDENPQKGEAPRTATMTNTRINSASFFNLMWKTVFVGIRDIVGIGAIPIKDPVKQQKKIAKKVKEQKKEDRKAERKKKNK